MLRFEWDEAKNKSNRRKHGIWFEEDANYFCAKGDQEGRPIL